MVPNGRQVNAAAPKALKIKARTVGEVAREALASGLLEGYGDGTEWMEEHLGFDRSLSARRLKVKKLETEDGISRVFEVPVDAKTAAPRVNVVVMRAIERSTTTKEVTDWFFVVTPRGALTKAVTMTGKIDDTGKSVRGSALGNISHMPAGALETRRLLRRELDFWLKGIGRKSGASGEGRP